ncbi:phage tail protein [Salmonella enterica subsp. enterica]|nr:phage tail protein [Salmonella enterica subsp. enterica]EDR2888310.1 phage tail protein [Salmonella enterica subsp. enterica]EDR6140831.1 phage tail protein [Salmonella enterica subsp. enterica]EDU9860153.1 phage tail protein [Salmonella enterica subsp. enterica]EDV0530439.1 phage tail protein [Salmonella enterica subsp. enterica]
MANKLTTDIVINLAGNLTAKARQYGANMSEFARKNERAMSVIKATTAAAGKGLDVLGGRYTAMIAGFGGGAMMKQFANTDRQLTRLGISAGKTKEEMNGIFNDTQDYAIKYKIDDAELVASLETINALTGNIDFGTKNLDMLGASIAGSGSDGASIGGLVSQFQKYGIAQQEDAMKAMDVLNKLGKEGAYELKDIAEKAVPALSLYAAAGGTGVKGVKDVGVVLESAIDATGNRDTAATLVENFIREVQNPKIAEKLKKKGVSTTDEHGKLRPLPELLRAVAAGSQRGAAKQRAAGNKQASAQGELMEVGFTQTSLDLVAGVSSKKGAENLERYMSVTADGKSIMEDAAYAAKDFTSAMQGLENTWKKFANGNLAGPVQELADALNAVDSKTAQNWLEVGKNIAIATGGIIAARKVFKIGKGAWDVLKPNKGGKGIPQGVADVFGSGVMPVYVTNMPAGGVGGGGNGGDLPSDSKGPKGKNPGKASMVSGLGVAGQMLSMVPFPEGDAEQTDLMAKLKANNERPTRWTDIKNWFQSFGENTTQPPTQTWGAAQQPQQNAAPAYPAAQPQLTGEIRVVVEGDARVKSVKVDQPGVTLSAAAGVTSTGQG